ncbi:nitroreductase [Inquilinus ginsengisoli]|uniref:Putative NAD(P)H nitroreductase n=1 Tax=Inquilinus ginsengisoli TaxID=363840 RepID=A0ABU1JM10_9PROT|nr:nitroreductase [Inquilinus ginsengisoli]MDR6289659.1 nitroreductase [Inquilinus ginsengisoli]
MEAIDLLLQRRSVPARNMVEPGPDAAALERILRAGTRVPDHGKLAPWRIQVLRKDGQRRLGEVMAGIFARENADATEALIEAMRQKPALAPLLLVVTHKPAPSAKIPELEQILSGGALCQNILMAAHAQGFCGSWITGWPAYHRQVVELLGHNPATDKILGFIYLGTPSEPMEDRPRPALSDVVSEWAGPLVQVA